MSNDVSIRPIRADEAAEAKRLGYTVAHPLMAPHLSMEELMAQWEPWGAFSDIEDVQKNYLDDGGVFLVAVAGGRLVGTGAFHRYAEAAGVAEVRRIWLLPEFRRQGLGYAMMTELMHRARTIGYVKMILWTNPIRLTRAVDFYHQLGFVDVPHAGADADELWMALDLNQTA